MKELSKEVIELIEKEAEVCFKEEHKPMFKAGMRIALTKPKVLEVAGLVSKEEMFEFARFLSDNFWVYTTKDTWSDGKENKSEPELYTLYLTQKEGK